MISIRQRRKTSTESTIDIVSETWLYNGGRWNEGYFVRFLWVWCKELQFDELRHLERLGLFVWST